MFNVFENDKFILIACVVVNFLSGSLFALLFIEASLLEVLSGLGSLATVFATAIAWRALAKWKSQDNRNRLNDRFMSLAVKANRASYRLPSITNSSIQNNSDTFSVLALEYLCLRDEIISLQRDLTLYTDNSISGFLAIGCPNTADALNKMADLLASMVHLTPHSINRSDYVKVWFESLNSTDSTDIHANEVRVMTSNLPELASVAEELRTVNLSKFVS